MKEGRVVEIYLNRKMGQKGVPMVKVAEVKALEGVGLEGDRYAEGKGAYSNSKRKTIRQVSLIAREAIEEANRLFSTDFTSQETRRNIVTEGIDLNSLVGEEFSVGEVKMRGIELCEPCERPSNLIGKKGFKDTFEGRGGLRAEILSSGIIYEADTITAPRLTISTRKFW